MNPRWDTLLSLFGVRTGVTGMAMILVPRGLRRLFADFAKLSDNELRVIGYVLIGTAATLFAQQATRRALSARIETLVREREALSAAPIH